MKTRPTVYALGCAMPGTTAPALPLPAIAGLIASLGFAARRNLRRRLRA